MVKNRKSIIYLKRRWVQALEFFFIDRERRLSKKVIPRRKPLKSQNVIMLESNVSPLNQLALSTVLPKLCDFYDARLNSYYGMSANLSQSIKEKIRSYFSFYWHIGVRNFTLFSFCKVGALHVTLAKDAILGNSTKDNFQNLTYKNVLIGDLVYDQYLRLYGRVTLDLNDERLVNLLSKAFWYVDEVTTFMRNNKVKAVIVGETCYFLAIPARAALAIGLDAFHISGQYIYRLNSTFLHAYKEKHLFREIYKSLDSKTRNDGKRKAAIMIAEERKALSKSLPSHLVNPSNVTKKPKRIVVFCHDFFDSPHAYGNNLFADFWEWLCAIGELSEKTNYDWWIKPHPFARNGNDQWISTLMELFPKLHLLPAPTSKEQLMTFKFDLILTTFGTCGSEYPQFGIKVMNASINNPHVKYGFNINPRTKEEFRSLIINLDDTLQKITIDWDELEEFYFMNSIYKEKCFFLKDYDYVWTNTRSTAKGLTWDVFKFANENHLRDTAELENALENFLRSGDYFFTRKHYQTASKG